MNVRSHRILLVGMVLTALLYSIGCGGGSSSSNSGTSASNMGTVHTMVSDDATTNWATIGVKVLSVSLVPSAGGSVVTVYTAPSSGAPMINLVQLDQLSEIIGNASVPVGSYSAVNLTLSANPGDVSLVTTADPDAGFFPASYTTPYTVPTSNIQIVGATGSAGNVTVPLKINLAQDLNVTAKSTNALDLEFDLKHPAFIVEHLPAGAAGPTWAVNFNGPWVRHHPRPDLTKFLLRHTYGQVASVSSDNSYITINRAFAVHPVTTPETATVSSVSLPIYADSTNGTLFYNLDSTAIPAPIYNFSALASTLPTQYVRIAARYQQNGTLVATRIFASSTFGNVWKNPEGHVLHVDTNTERMHITTEDGGATAVTIGSETNFYFQNSNTPIGTGTAFFNGSTQGLPNLARGFKVNVTVDPASSAPQTALAVEIDVARYDGAITLPTGTGFNYTRTFAADNLNGIDNYSGTLDYISSNTQITDQQGNTVDGFYWWDFAYPMTPNPGSSTTTTPVQAYEAAVGGSVNFGWTPNGTLGVRGLSNATWNDPAEPNAWAADWTVLIPTPAPLGVVTVPFQSSNNTFAFTAPVPAGATGTASPVTVDLSTVSGSATLVYQVARQNGVITIAAQDITNPTTLATVGTNLGLNSIVKVFGVPQSDGSIKAYVLFYYTGTPSTN